MNTKINILIVDDNSASRRQLARIIQSAIYDVNLYEAKTYEAAIEIARKFNINILVSDLFLFSDIPITIINVENYISKGIKLANEVRKINRIPISIFIVSSCLDSSFLSYYQRLDYRDIGVDIFLDRTVTPFEKFEDVFKVKLIESIHGPLDSASNLLKKNNIKYCFSHWTLFCDSAHILLWQERLSILKISFCKVSVLSYDSSEFSFLRSVNIINEDDDYPLLLISESPEMIDNIKIGARTLKLVEENKSLKNFLCLIQAQLCNTQVCDIKKQMKLAEYWEQFNIDDFVAFLSEKGDIELISDLRYEISPEDERRRGFSSGKHSTSINFPCQCMLNNLATLKIQLVVQDLCKTHALERINNVADDEVEMSQLDIYITAENFIIKQKRKSLVLPKNDNSKKLIFELVPIELGEQILEIEFFYECSRVGYAIVKTIVKASLDD
jgi:CheY-like chemotaxis protein